MEAAIRATTVAIGKAFEERSLSILNSRLSMSLTRVGGVGDGGVDIQGWWWLPRLHSDPSSGPDQPDRRRIRLLAQCKAFKNKLGPIHVRELEGAALLHLCSGSARLPNLKLTPPTASTQEPPDSNQESPESPELVAVLLSSAGFSPVTVRRAMASPVPFLLLHLPALDDDRLVNSQTIPMTRVDDPVGSIVWNPRLAGASGLLGGHMEVRWELGRGGRPVLYWRGQRLKHWVPEMESESVN